MALQTEVDMTIDPISAEYLSLAFALESHVEGLVDAYYGPPEPRERTEQRSQEPQTIAADVAALRREVEASAYPARRKAYLDVQLRAMETLGRKLSGEPIAYREEVRACFDIEAQSTPETVFDAAIAELDRLLPGSGSVAERRQAWQQQFEVTPEVARRMIDRIAVEARTRTAALIELPVDETVAFELVSDKPWSGYNWYLGQARSRVECNTDLPIRANSLVGLICHEAYPGHHTEHALKEQHLFVERGWGEHAMCLVAAPECVISEGIATLAPEIIFGTDAATWAAAEIYPLAGRDGDPEREQQVAAAGRALRALGANAALLLHEEGTDPEEVVRYMMRYGLSTEREARQSLRFISDPLWRAYVWTYHVGRDLLERWIEGGDRQARFRTLLTEQVYPSLIERWIAEERTAQGDYPRPM